MITAVYSGDSTFIPSQSGQLHQVIKKPRAKSSIRIATKTKTTRRKSKTPKIVNSIGCTVCWSMTSPWKQPHLTPCDHIPESYGLGGR